MKTISPGLAAHLAQNGTTLTTCWRIVRPDGQVFCYTEFDEDLVVDGLTYVAASGYQRSALSNELGTGVNSADVLGAFDDDSISERDVRAGKFNGAEAYISLVNWADPSQGHLMEFRGPFGEAVLGRQGVFTIELRSMMQRLQQQIMEFYGDTCRADLGDSRCKIPLLPPEVARSTAYAQSSEAAPVFVRVPDAGVGSSFADKYRDRIFECTTAGTSSGSPVSYDYTVGNTTTDGTAVFTCREAWTRAAVVAAGAETTAADHLSFDIAVTDSRAVNGWFKDGVATFESGDNAGFSMEIAAWVQTGGVVTLSLEAPFAPAVGDRLYLWPGCDKTLLGTHGCKAKFANVRNRRAHDFIPGQDFLTTYADAQ